MAKVTRRKLDKQKQLDSAFTNVQGKYFVKKGPSPLSEREILWLADKAKDYFLEGPSLIKVSSPVVIVGDVHG